MTFRSVAGIVSCRDRRVVCFTGDGSFLMNIQELATAVEEEARITVILLDNAHLGLVRQQQELFYGRRFHGSRGSGRSREAPASGRGSPSEARSGSCAPRARARFSLRSPR